MNTPTRNDDTVRAAVAAPAMVELPAPLPRDAGHDPAHGVDSWLDPTGTLDNSSRPDGDGQSGLVRHLPESLGWVSRLAETDSPLDAVLSAHGHDRRCRRRVRAGLAVACECQTRQPTVDAAIVIGLAMRFARTGLSRRLPLPFGIVDQLARHVGKGDPAAIMVLDWLARHRLVAARMMPPGKSRPALRIACEEAE